MESSDMVVVDNINFSIKISPKVNELWWSYRQVKAKDCEVFGVLIGNKNLNEENYSVLEVTVPQHDDLCSRTSFKLRDPEHQRRVDYLHKNSGGELIYLGTWHTHPEKIPLASNIDVQDWKECRLRNIERQLFFIIIGTEKNALYYFENENLQHQEF
ncbi:Mov34/MPN/PAD-1 family protein [Stenoxybacter acetivorans]|uniref:Mov34/MPN/PAD-1 family protein n=1 Tax=Stenoxybacter acetivorans TaxID=422441 RepID=UPI00069156ED|nr:Mov34/MPN/PAD-1 family protein [Stenoxybacter acetivorans]